MNRLLLAILSAFFSSVSVASSASCLRIGLLGEFEHKTGSFSQPFGREIVTGTALGRTWLEKNIPGACVKFELIDIDNSIANIDGYIRKWANQGIHDFIGLGTSDQAIAAKKALFDTKSVLITPTASARPLLEKPSRTILLFPTNDLIADGLAHEVRTRGVKKILSVYASNSKYSVDMNSSFKIAFEKRGGMVEEIAIRAGRSDLSEVIRKIKGSDLHYVFVPLYELDAARVVTEISRNGLNPFFVGTDAWGTYSSVIKRLVKNRKQKAMIPVIYDPMARVPLNRKFVSEYNNVSDKMPTDLAAFSFDAVLVAYKINKICGILIDDDKLRHCLHKILPLNTTTGVVGATKGLSLQRSIRIQDIDLEKVK